MSNLLSLENRMDQLEKIISDMEEKIDVLEKKLNATTIEPNSFMKSIISKIDILKNMIKTTMPEGEFISINLIDVECIENDIIKANKVNYKQLMLLNEIYSRLIKN